LGIDNLFIIRAGVIPDPGSKHNTLHP